MVYALGPSEAALRGVIDDVLANPKQCALDALLMKMLHVNTIRVYTVDNSRNHTECMNTFKSHGIYVIIGLWTLALRIAPVRHKILLGRVLPAQNLLRLQNDHMFEES